MLGHRCTTIAPGLVAALAAATVPSPPFGGRCRMPGGGRHDGLCGLSAAAAAPSLPPWAAHLWKGRFHPPHAAPGRGVGQTARAFPGTPPPAIARLLDLLGLSFNQPPYRQASARTRPPQTIGRPRGFAVRPPFPHPETPQRDPPAHRDPPPAPAAARGRPRRATCLRPGPGPRLAVPAAGQLAQLVSKGPRASGGGLPCQPGLLPAAQTEGLEAPW